jgi:hypothetical protein
MKGSVGEDDVEGCGRGFCPLGDAGFKPVMRGTAFAGFFEHLSGAIETSDDGAGPSLGQNAGAVAGAAAEVDDCHRLRQTDLGCEIAARPRAFFLEQQILVGLPTGHINFYYGGMGAVRCLALLLLAVLFIGFLLTRRIERLRREPFELSGDVSENR